jgi:hypothetical protein
MMMMRDQPTSLAPAPLEEIEIRERGAIATSVAVRGSDDFHHRPRVDLTLQKSLARADRSARVLYSINI